MYRLTIGCHEGHAPLLPLYENAVKISGSCHIALVTSLETCGCDQNGMDSTFFRREDIEACSPDLYNL